MTPAGKLQKYLRERVEALGGQYRKTQWEGRSGCPDCYIWLPGGRYAWIEVKAPGDRFRGLQLPEFTRMSEAGLNMAIARSTEDIDRVLEALTT